MAEDPADHPAGIPDVIVPCPVPLSVVHGLKPVNVTHHDAEGFAAFPDEALQFLFFLPVGGLILCAGQFVTPGHLIGNGKSLQMLPFSPDILLSVLHADNKMTAVGGISR